MRFFCIILLSIAFTAVTSQVTDGGEGNEDITSLKKQAVAECTGIHPISEDYMKDIMTHGHNDDEKEVKCWRSCLMEKLGMMKEGKFDWECCKFISKLCLTNEEDKAKVDKIDEKCQAEVPEGETDEYQFAYSMALFKNKYWNEFGLQKGIFEHQFLDHIIEF